MIKRIGVLTSGGDCAGLNAAIRAITHRAILNYGWEVFGILKGTTGLINRPLEVRPMTLGECDSTFLRAGGTILGTTNKADPFNFPCPDGVRRDFSQNFIDGYHELGLDAFIGIGGDGSMDILRRLAVQGNLNLVTIPKTIDNDLGLTENAIGYATAVEVATEALDRLQPTAASHQRVMILEVMGRDAGHIAMAAGIAGGADIILVPEIPYKLENIYRKIQSLSSLGRNFSLIIVAEAVRDEDGTSVVKYINEKHTLYGGIGQYLGDKITQDLEADVRVTSLGHVQRGGQPCAVDRILASSFGIHAVDLIAKKSFDRMVAWQNRKIIDVPIQDAILGYRALQLDDILVDTARGMGICVGDN